MFLKISHKRIGFVVAFAILAQISCHTLHNRNQDSRFKPSQAEIFFDKNHHKNFSDYLTQTQQILESHKVFTDVWLREQELDAAMPFEQPPDSHCDFHSDDSPQRGILLLHGLSDTPLAMRDLSNALSKRCFLSRTILLPGHGTRPGDLLTVKRSDWIKAARFGVESLKQQVDEVYIGGFSLGGLLAVYIGLIDPEIDGVLAISPALTLNNLWQLRQSVWLRHLIDWVDKDKPDDYARYESMPTNGLAETYLLTQDLRKQLNEGLSTPPVFMAQSADDPIINTIANQQIFIRHFSHPSSRLLIYSQKPVQAVNSFDHRITYENSYLPNQRITGFSHVSLHIAPQNIHYGVNGDYRNCGASIDRREEDVIRCMKAREPWRGELLNDNTLETLDASARLTFNPRFDELVIHIEEFFRRNTDSTL